MRKSKLFDKIASLTKDCLIVIHAGDDIAAEQLWWEMYSTLSVIIPNYTEGLWADVSGDFLADLTVIRKKLLMFIASFDALPEDLPLMPKPIPYDAEHVYLRKILEANAVSPTNFERVTSWVTDHCPACETEATEWFAKIRDLKAIAESPDSEEAKWPRIKPVIIWMIDKDVQIQGKLLRLALIAMNPVPVENFALAD
jgi:hypothetical protein